MSAAHYLFDKEWIPPGSFDDPGLYLMMQALDIEHIVDQGLAALGIKGLKNHFNLKADQSSVPSGWRGFSLQLSQYPGRNTLMNTTFWLRASR